MATEQQLGATQQVAANLAIGQERVQATVTDLQRGQRELQHGQELHITFDSLERESKRGRNVTWTVIGLLTALIAVFAFTTYSMLANSYITVRQQSASPGVIVERPVATESAPLEAVEPDAAASAELPLEEQRPF